MIQSRVEDKIGASFSSAIELKAAYNVEIGSMVFGIWLTKEMCILDH